MGIKVIDNICEGVFAVFIYGLIGLLVLGALSCLFSGESGSVVLALVMGGFAFFQYLFGVKHFIKGEIYNDVYSMYHSCSISFDRTLCIFNITL